jgi:hypothetical protein
MYNMLNFCIDYCAAIDKLTDLCALNLCAFKISKAEWDLAIVLQDVLKVCDPSSITKYRVADCVFVVAAEGQDCLLFLLQYCYSCLSDPCYG